MQHKRLQTGTATEKHDTILGLHRRLYHKETSELRKLLTNSGVPLSVVATVDDVFEVLRDLQLLEARPC